MRKGRVGYGQAKLFMIVMYVSMYREFYRGGGGAGRQEVVHLIYFGTYNIRNGQNGGLEYTLKRMLQDNVYLGVFQETKVTQGIYTR